MGLGSALYRDHGRNYLGSRQELFMHLFIIPQRVWQARFQASLCPTP
jgi:hypothetical protein